MAFATVMNPRITPLILRPDNRMIEGMTRVQADISDPEIKRAIDNKLLVVIET